MLYSFNEKEGRMMKKAGDEIRGPFILSKSASYLSKASEKF